jgi:15-hydroxyprostaglandin dehydrogenase (NAD)
MTVSAQKVAIVTGAAAGIGLALTKHLFGRGYRVVLADIDDAKGLKAQQEIGADALFVHCDVSDWDSNAALFKKAFEWGGRIDFFAANAGVEERESTYSLSKPGEEPNKPNLSTIEVDLNSVIYGLRLLRYYVRESATGQGARMVVSSSMAGIYPMYLGPLYSAAKHGVSLLVSDIDIYARN